MAYKDIVFLNGLIKSREKYLVKKEKFLAMSDAATAAEAFDMLKETPFGGDDKGELAATDYEKLIFNEWENFRAFFFEYAPSEAFIKAALIKYDFYNAEVLTRKKHVETADDMTSHDGFYDLKKVRALVDEPDARNGLPVEIAEAIKTVDEQFEKSEATGKSVSLAFMRAYYKFMKKHAVGRDWKENVAFEIDAKNISAAFRAVSSEEAGKEYIDGGKLAFSTLALIADGKEKKALEKTVKTPYFDLIKLGFTEKAGGGRLTVFEREVEGFALKKLKEKRFETDGVIPWLLYFNYKVNEIADVRLVLAVKLAGGDAGEIKKRLRECYEM